MRRTWSTCPRCRGTGSASWRTSTPAIAPARLVLRLRLHRAARTRTGNHLNAPTGPFARDAFGHIQLGGVGSVIVDLIKQELRLKARLVRLGPGRAGGDALRLAHRPRRGLRPAAPSPCARRWRARRREDGEPGAGQPTRPYRCDLTLVDLDVVANAEKLIPRDWINEAGNDVNEQFLDYARPLIQGEVVTPIEHGLPRYARVNGVSVGKKLGPWEG